MKFLKILNVLFLIPIIIASIFFLSMLIFQCTYSESDMEAHCKINFFESVITILGGITLILAFTGFIWVIPAIIIAIITFKADYTEIKTNNLPFNILFKKISFYAIIPYLLILITMILYVIFFLTYSILSI